MLSVNSLEISFSGEIIFSDVSFLIRPRDRIGLTGKNGSGKSSLMKAITGEVKPSAGEISIPGDKTIAYLPQNILFNEDDLSLTEEIRKAFPEIIFLENKIVKLNKELAERTDYESDEYAKISEQLAESTERSGFLNAESLNADIEKTLKGLGFSDEDMNRKTKELSGGWRMRVELAKLLLSAPDVLMLDEPTNHLDIESIEWLEQFLKSYKGAVILISHDRRFLDNITERTLEIEHGQMYEYPASYSDYVEMRKERIRLQAAEKKNQEKQIKETEEFIEKFRYKATKAKQVQSRIKQLEKTKEVIVDETDDSSINFTFPPAPRSGQIVSEIKSLSKSYGENKVLKNVDLLVEKGEKIAFVGKNGEGKTTLSKIILGLLDYEKGTVKKGHNILQGYYAQNQEEQLESQKTVFETLNDQAVGEVRKKIRSILGGFMFSGEDVDKKVSVLSGGEKSRLALASLLLEPHNLLVMDEPTNHLDIPSKDILKKALKEYDGTLILVSHDRYFLDGLVDTVYEIRNKGIRQHLGGIEDFLRRRKMETMAELEANPSQKGTKKASVKKNSNKQQYLKSKEKEKHLRKIRKKVSECEKEIERLENEMSELETELANPENVTGEKYNKYENLENELSAMMEKWEKHQKELEKDQ